MKFPLLLLILFAIAFTSSGQVTKSFISEIKTHSHDPAGIKKTIRQLEEKPSLRVFNREGRYNYFELKENSFCIEIISVPGNKTEEKYFITYFEHGGRIVYFNFVKRYEQRQTYDDILYEVDTTFINEYNLAHKTSFGRNDFFSSSIYDTYGIAWGLGSYGRIHEPMEAVFQMVERKDIDSLKKLCYSLCNESKAYGATGLYLLDKMKVFPDNCLIDLFKEIRASDSKINFGPGGCIVFGDELITTAMSDIFLENVHRVFLAWGKEKAQGL